MPTRYWIGVACHEHVKRGVAGGFAQLCHGKKAPLARLSRGDYLMYYSPKKTMTGKDPLQEFTAIGEVADSGVTQVIRDKTHWGAVFRYGLVEVSEADFRRIAEAMKAEL